jgi:hypothetical protein
MTYAKKQRNEIYRKALRMFYHYKRKGSLAFLCDCIGEIAGGYFRKDEFEELIMFCPQYGVFGWWEYDPCFDYDSRETALLFMIAMTD